MAWQDSVEHGAMKAAGGWPDAVRMAGARKSRRVVRGRDGVLPAGLTILALAAIGLIALVVLFALR